MWAQVRVKVAKGMGWRHATGQRQVLLAQVWTKETGAFDGTVYPACSPERWGTQEHGGKLMLHEEPLLNKCHLRLP